MSETRFSASYERKFSDGNYGSEGLSLSMTVAYEDDGGLAIDPIAIEARARALHTELREAVLTALAGSTAERVAWAAKRELHPPIPVTVASGPDGTPVDLEDLPY